MEPNAGPGLLFQTGCGKPVATRRWFRMTDTPIPGDPGAEAGEREGPARTKPRSRRSARHLAETIERQIDENLKRLYSEMVEEPIPDHLQQLLEQLKNRDGPQ